MALIQIICVTVLSITTVAAFSQSIDNLKLNINEIPAGYTQPSELQCVTPHAATFYDEPSLYEMFLGKIIKKDFQSFSKKGDEGSVLYFEFEKPFTGQGFLNGLLWGESTKATKSEPDEYYVKGNILVIWSFNLKSDIKKVSMEKVKRVLN